MLAGTRALGTQVQVRVGKTGLGLLGVPGEYSAQGWRPWSWAQAHQKRTVGGGGEAGAPARGLVFGVGPGCLNQGLSLFLGCGRPSRFLHLLTVTPYPSLGIL